MLTEYGYEYYKEIEDEVEIISPQKTLLIDGDIYCIGQQAVAEDETDWGDDIWSLTTNLSEAKDIFKSTLEGFMETLEARDQVVCLSDKTTSARTSILPTKDIGRKPVSRSGM